VPEIRSVIKAKAKPVTSHLTLDLKFLSKKGIVAKTKNGRSKVDKGKSNNGNRLTFL
jgi:hypothetical protein